ncbi:hypothetical protein [Halothermothrix orenii]|uniref:DUF8042 domain-containing protein n=1 Tax=Halothermothrix orenii (strain H 168 / OCM 544 / DSM 9562) TaxID=373903 RepID=B8CYT5_HALOH|nr:hypothetical protein [Halothermothrix orenii]ACL70454.1 hypothetical protein Hore_17050 [Halothermothrix orenii H 168]
MKVIIDEQIVKIEKLPENLLECLKVIEKEINQSNKAINTVHIDGVPLEEFTLDKVKEMDISDVDTIEYETKSAEELFSEGVQMLEDYLPKLKSGVYEIINLLEENRLSDAFSLIAKATEGLHWVINNLMLFRDFLLNDIEKEIDFKDFDNYMSNTNNFFAEINRAIERRDYVLIRDLFEYEIVPKLEKWQNLNQKIKELYL